MASVGELQSVIVILAVMLCILSSVGIVPKREFKVAISEFELSVFNAYFTQTLHFYSSRCIRMIINGLGTNKMHFRTICLDYKQS